MVINKSAELIATIIEKEQEVNREFFKEVGKLVEDKEIESELLRQTLLNYIMSKEIDPNTRYRAFVTLVTDYRRSNKHDCADDLFTKYRGEFQSKKLYTHIYLIHLSELNFENKYQKIIEEAYAEINNDKSVDPGEWHLFATSVARVLSDTCYSDEIRQQIKAKWFELAVTYCEKAIEAESSHPKFYYTRSMLCLADDNFEQALLEIREAIRKEDPDSLNYLLRLNKYRSFEQQIILRKQIFQLEARYRELDKILVKTRAQFEENQQINLVLKDDIKEIKKSLMGNVETIAFFAGIISLVLGSLTLAAGQTVFDAFMLIITLFVTLLLIIVGFSTVKGELKPNQLKLHKIIAGGCVLVLVVIGIMLTCL